MGFVSFTFRSLQAWLNQRLSFLLDPGCQLCLNASQSPICPSCQNNYKLRASATPLPQSANQTLSVAQYSNRLKRLLYGYKFYEQDDSRWALVALFQYALEQQVNPCGSEQAHWVVTLPSHREGKASHMELLARLLAYRLGWTYQAQGLQWTRPTQSQHSLKSRHQRLWNMKNSLKVNEQFTQELSRSTQRPTVLILDDIFTTGATVQAALDAFQKASIDCELNSLVLYQVPLKDSVEGIPVTPNESQREPLLLHS